MTLEWCYNEGFVNFSMPDYFGKALDKLQYKPTVPQYATHEYNCPNFDINIHYAQPSDSENF